MCGQSKLFNWSIYILNNRLFVISFYKDVSKSLIFRYCKLENTFFAKVISGMLDFRYFGYQKHDTQDFVEIIWSFRDFQFRKYHKISQKVEIRKYHKNLL